MTIHWLWPKHITFYLITLRLCFLIQWITQPYKKIPCNKICLTFSVSERSPFICICWSCVIVCQTVVHWVVMLGSVALYFIVTLAYSAMCISCNPPSDPYWIMQEQMSDPMFYLVCAITTVVALLPRYWIYQSNTISWIKKPVFVTFRLVAHFVQNCDDTNRHSTFYSCLCYCIPVPWKPVTIVAESTILVQQNSRMIMKVTEHWTAAQSSSWSWCPWTSRYSECSERSDLHQRGAYFSLAYFPTTTFSPPGTRSTCWGTLSPPPPSHGHGIWTGSTLPSGSSGSGNGGVSGTRGGSIPPAGRPHPLPPWGPLSPPLLLPLALTSQNLTSRWTSSQRVHWTPFITENLGPIRSLTGWLCGGGSAQELCKMNTIKRLQIKLRLIDSVF